MARRISNHDEYLLSRLLDGDLPDDQAAELHARMAREPDLRTAFASLGRIEQALRQRRSDRIEVDWSQFHGQLMAAVNREPAPTTIRANRWLRIGAALAAAAAIALVVSIHGLNPASPPGVGPADSGGPVGELLVRFERPKPAPPREDGQITVKFTRSSELAQTMQTEDERNGRRPRTVHAAATPAGLSDSAVSAVLDGLPM